MMQSLDRLLDRALHEDLTDSPDARLGRLPHAEKFLAKRRTFITLLGGATARPRSKRRASISPLPFAHRSAGVGLTLPVLALCSRIAPPCPTALARRLAHCGLGTI
jgi:hypothetical protein